DQRQTRKKPIQISLAHISIPLFKRAIYAVRSRKITCVRRPCPQCPRCRRRLLRARRERPRRRSTKERDEFAAPHGAPLVAGGPEPSSRDLAAVIPAASRQATRKARAP